MNAARLLSAQRELTSSFVPDNDANAELDREERGAIGIYGEVTGNRNFAVASRKWHAVARRAAKERHRAEARACLLYASF